MTNLRLFISYSRKDEEYAWNIALALMELGIDVWLDQMHISPGQHWDRAIHQALKTSSHLLVIHSRNSFNSETVWDEWSYFLSRQKPVLPLIIDDTELPFRLERLQSINFHRMSFDEAIKRLLSILRPYPIPPSPDFQRYYAGESDTEPAQTASNNGNFSKSRTSSHDIKDSIYPAIFSQWLLPEMSQIDTHAKGMPQSSQSQLVSHH